MFAKDMAFAPGCTDRVDVQRRLSHGPIDEVVKSGLRRARFEGECGSRKSLQA